MGQGASNPNADLVDVLTRQPGASQLYTPTDWFVVGSAGAPVFENGWVSNDAGFRACAFRRTAEGKIEMRGQIADGNLGQAVFTFPAGFLLPAGKDAMVGAVSVTPANVVCTIFASGVFRVETGVPADGIILDGISFSIVPE